MKRVLITGGAGAIGGNLARRLTAEGGCKVVVLDDFSSGRRENIPAGVETVEGDVSDAATVARLFKRRFHEVYHLAAFFANQNSFEHPVRDFRTNALGTLLVLDAASRLDGLETVVFASTSSLKGDLEAGLEKGFSTPYMTSKFAGELYGRWYRRARGLPLRVVRYYNCYGPGEYPGRYRNVVINFIDAALRGKPLTVTGEGSETRDFTFVEDIVSGTLAVGRGAGTVGPVYQIGTGRETRIRDLAETILRLTGSRSRIQAAPQRGWDKTRRRRADLALARQVGYKPTVGLEEGLRRTIAWYRERVR